MSGRLFFELSFEEWRTKHAPAGVPVAQLRAIWRVEAARLWADIRAGEHYHGGVPCAHEPTCSRFVAASTPEAAQ